MHFLMIGCIVSIYGGIFVLILGGIKGNALGTQWGMENGDTYYTSNNPSELHCTIFRSSSIEVKLQVSCSWLILDMARKGKSTAWSASLLNLFYVNKCIISYFSSSFNNFIYV